MADRAFEAGDIAVAFHRASPSRCADLDSEIVLAHRRGDGITARFPARLTWGLELPGAPRTDCIRRRSGDRDGMRAVTELGFDAVPDSRRSGVHGSMRLWRSCCSLPLWLATSRTNEPGPAVRLWGGDGPGIRSGGGPDPYPVGRALDPDAVRDTPSTSSRATTHRPGAELHEPGRRSMSSTRPGMSVRRGLPPGRRAVGLRQVDGMPREPQRARSRAGQGARKAPAAPAPVRRGWHGTARRPGGMTCRATAVAPRESASTRKCSTSSQRTAGPSGLRLCAAVGTVKLADRSSAARARCRSVFGSLSAVHLLHREPAMRLLLLGGPPRQPGGRGTPGCSPRRTMGR